MRLSEIGGEFGFLERLSQRHSGVTPSNLDVGNGDDAAVFRTGTGSSTVVSTDLIVEGIHFKREWSCPFDIGWKSAAVNLSDIAAMGAKPAYAFVSLAIPDYVDVEFLDTFYDGFCANLIEFGVVIAGGDTSRSLSGLVISVTLIGHVPEGQQLTREGASVGDCIVVTGSLGNSRAGLELLSRFGKDQAHRISPDLVTLHLRPSARTDFGMDSALHTLVTAAMDVSDGLCDDVNKLCRHSGVGARIELECVPVSTNLRNCSNNLLMPPVEYALAGGEDYELLMCVAPGRVGELQDVGKRHSLQITQIGAIAENGVMYVRGDGTVVEEIDAMGWDHFR